ncbi:zinc finger protein 713-like [Teleopsis dalmanni]|uniref:zinc finger protein 713-like n=1 Tax=Teleopsis dalmanni TaxID=139649 RepID=UPI0018CDA160|nr:zinc finger protein 713-like [Teleopsis dalmanni]
MSLKCNVPGCKNTNRKSSEWFYEGRFVRYPANEELQQKWCESLQVTSGYVCGVHFEESAWRLIDVIMETPLSKRRLKPGAVPTLPSATNQESDADDCAETLREELLKSLLKNPKKTRNVDNKQKPLQNELMKVDANVESLPTNITQPQSNICVADRVETVQDRFILVNTNVSNLFTDVTQSYSNTCGPETAQTRLMQVDINVENLSTDVTQPQSNTCPLDKIETVKNWLNQVNTNVANSATDVTQSQFDILGTELKYGEVVFNNIENKLIICCKFCVEKYQSLEDFMEHIKSEHIQVQNNAKLDTDSEKLFGNNLCDEEALQSAADISPFDVRDTSNNESLLINLIELYENQPSLWNINHENYFEQFMHTQDLEQLYEKVVVDLQELHLNTIDELAMQLTKFNNWFSALEYIRLQCQQDKKVFYCKYPNLYEALTFLRGHVLPYQCTLCQVVFKTKSKLLKHLNNNQRCSNRLQGVVYECQYCNKRFAEQRQINCHERQHTNERPYQCTICRITFRNYSTLYRHKQRTHLRQKPYQCSNCRRTFYTNGALLQHQNLHYGIRNAVCEVCGRRYLSNRYLNRHIKAFHTKHSTNKFMHINSTVVSTTRRNYVSTIVQNKQSFN